MSESVNTVGELRHAVMFKFKEGVSTDAIQEVEAAFAALPSHINTITGFEWGTNVSPEGLDQGFTHCFLVSFENQAGLDVYLPHAAHQAFVALLGPSLAENGVFVFDYVAR